MVSPWKFFKAKSGAGVLNMTLGMEFILIPDYGNYPRHLTRDSLKPLRKAYFPKLRARRVRVSVVKLVFALTTLRS
jgi:hypothetical protein